MHGSKGAWDWQRSPATRYRNSVNDPLQNATTYTYDYRGRPTQRVDALGKITAFSYVSTGCQSCGGGGEKLTSLTDAAGSKTSFAYDQRGLLTSITDPLQKVTSLIYDVNGRPTNKTDRNGTALAYSYTPAGRPASITYPDQSQVTNTYDSLDRLTQMNDTIGTSSFGYDADGRITSFTDADGFTLSYLYDAAGNLTQITYPDSTTVTYGYDAANRLATVTNWLGEQATYVYDGDGRLATSTQFNGITTAYTFDAASRLTGMGSVVASYQFTLDGNGNRINSAQTEPLTPTYSTSLTGYGYNAQQNRLLSAGALNYAYDNEGQLISFGNTGLTFDYNHRLVGIGSDTQFSYDGRGNRLSATRAGVTTRYIYDPWGNLIADADSNGVTHKYIYGKGLLAVATSSGRYCYHFNGTGSTVAITDVNQNVVNSYAYDPFGQILGQQETIAQPFKYVGQYGVMAEPNGLYYMRARYYDPNVGRFICEDPLGFAGGDVNLFAYVQNDPINKIDPFGLQAGSDAIQGLPALWPAVVAGAQVVGGAIVGVVTSPVTVGAVVVGGVIHVTSGTIAEEPLIPIFIKREAIPDSDPDAAKPDELPEPWPAAGDNRGFCIQMYVMCQNQSWTGNCQSCMDRCTGSGNGNWPFRGPGGCHPRKKGCQ